MVLRASISTIHHKITKIGNLFSLKAKHQPCITHIERARSNGESFSFNYYFFSSIIVLLVYFFHKYFDENYTLYDLNYTIEV